MLDIRPIALLPATIAVAMPQNVHSLLAAACRWTAKASRFRAACACMHTLKAMYSTCSLTIGIAGQVYNVDNAVAFETADGPL